MGLDIFIGTDKFDESLSTIEVNTENNRLDYQNLSRTFCNFMCRENVIEHLPELDQIGKLTNIDISPLYEMNYDPNDDESLEYFINRAESEEEKQSLIQKAENEKAKLVGNFDKIYNIISDLLENLNDIDELPKLLLPTEFDSLDNETYFSNFKSNPGDGYIGNNFGQDLRYFKNYLDIAKKSGATSVWFVFG